ALSGRLDGAFQSDFAHEFGYVARERRNGLGSLGEFGIVSEHEAIVLDHRAASGCVDDDRVEPAVLDLPRPGENVGARVTVRVLSEMMGERAAASGARSDHHLAAMASQEPDRGFIDLGRQNLLSAAAEQRDAAGSLPLARKNLRPV